MLCTAKWLQADLVWGVFLKPLFGEHVIPQTLSPSCNLLGADAYFCATLQALAWEWFRKQEGCVAGTLAWRMVMVLFLSLSCNSTPLPQKLLWCPLPPALPWAPQADRAFHNANACKAFLADQNGDYKWHFLDKWSGLIRHSELGFKTFMVRKVANAALANATLMLSSKNWKRKQSIRDWG